MQRSELKKMVPHGYGKLIAQKAGMHEITISQFLNGKNDNVSAELATLEILAELAEKKRNLEVRINGGV